MVSTVLTNISRGEKRFIFINYILLTVIGLIILIPMISVLTTSFVSAEEIAVRGEFILWPHRIDLTAYNMVFKSPNIWSGYRNTLFVVAIGTSMSMISTILLAYPLSKRSLRGRTFVLGLVFFTMLFTGGTVPTYMTVKALGLINSRWALVLPYMVNAWNMLLMRNFFYSVPDALEEAAFLDGANQLQILIRIILPLSLPAIATIAMFYGVTYWNAWWPGVMYLNSSKYLPIQNIMRTIVLSATATQAELDISSVADDSLIPTAQTLKSATIVVGTVPILLVYPFIQKYFVKGVMVGSVKG